MLIQIEPGVRLFVDIEGPGLVPDGPSMRDMPTLVLLHGGPGYDHSGFKPAFSRLADIAQIVYFDHRGHGRSDRCPPEQWTLDHFADDVRRHAPDVRELLVCGGGAFNDELMRRIAAHLPAVRVQRTDARGLPATQVEACAFAWLARAFCEREFGSLAAVTGAAGPRLLGALYPA